MNLHMPVSSAKEAAREDPWKHVCVCVFALVLPLVVIVMLSHLVTQALVVVPWVLLALRSGRSAAQCACRPGLTLVVDMLGKKPKTNVAKVQLELVKDGHDVLWSMIRRLMGRSSKCVKAVKRPLLTPTSFV